MVKIYSLNIAPLASDDAQLVIVANKCDHNVDPYARVPKPSLDAFLSTVKQKYPHATTYLKSALEDERSALMQVLPSILEPSNTPDDDESTPVPGNVICAAVRCTVC